MMKNQSVIPLLEKWEEFSSEFPGKDIYAFAQWLTYERTKTTDHKNSVEQQGNGARLAILITRLQKYLSLYIKPVINKLGFLKEHEYNFLYQISRMNKPSKNDLSKENLVEFSTGRDVIRRLIAKKLVTEKADEQDRRATILTITALGKKILGKSFAQMSESFTDFLGDLTQQEQEQLIALITKLNAYQAIKHEREVLSAL